MRRLRLFGLDLFDVVVHVVVTIGVAAMVDSITAGPTTDVMVGGTLVASVLVLSWRRKRALREREREPEVPLGRLEELEDRVMELEAVHQRLLDVEERLDFTERLLARSRDAMPLQPGPNG